MSSPQIQQAQVEFTQSGNHDLLAPLWKLCETGGFPSESHPPQWEFESGVVSGNLIHLKFRVHFMEESPSCCAETPDLRPLSKAAFSTRSIESGEYETYSDSKAPTPDWVAIFNLAPDAPSYEDSFS